MLDAYGNIMASVVEVHSKTGYLKLRVRPNGSSNSDSQFLWVAPLDKDGALQVVPRRQHLQQLSSPLWTTGPGGNHGPGQGAHISLLPRLLTPGAEREESLAMVRLRSYHFSCSLMCCVVLPFIFQLLLKLTINVALVLCRRYGFSGYHLRCHAARAASSSA